MKKTITILTLFFVFSVHSQVQNIISYDEVEVIATPEEEPVETIEDPIDSNELVSFEQVANDDIVALGLIVTMDEDLKNNLYQLMILKYEALANDNLTPQQRDEILLSFNDNLMSALNQDQRNQLVPPPLESTD